MSANQSLVQSTNTQIGYIDENSLTEVEKNQIKKLKTDLDPKNSQTILTFGVGAQKDISKFTGDILARVKAKDSGKIGEVLTDLTVQIKKVDTKSLLAQEKSFFASLPGVGYFFDKIKQFQAKYSSIEENINNITNKLDSQYELMIRDVIMFEELYKENLKYFQQLNLIILAGQQKIQELELELTKLENKYETKPEELLAQEIQQLRNFVDQLEIRVHDLELTRISTLQSFPQIQMIKAADQGLAGKIQSAILNTIPLWKRHITMAIGLYNQQVVLGDLQKVDETTDQLLVSNSQLLKENSTRTARTLQKGIISIETLELVQNNLLASISEVQEIVRTGNQERQLAKQKIQDLEKELEARLIEQN